LQNNQDSKSSDFAAGAALSQDSIRGFSEREAEMLSSLKSNQPPQS